MLQIPSKIGGLCTDEKMVCRNIIKVALAAMLNFGIVQAQPFFNVGDGVRPRPILSLYADASINILYAGGEFSIAGNIQSHCIASWNGVNWDSTRNQLFYPPFDQVRSIAKFNDEIYIGGPFGFFDTLGNLAGLSIAKWDSLVNAWINFGANPYGTVYNLYEYNNELYIMGTFDTIGGIYASKIARYDGTNWYTYPPLDTTGGGAVIQSAIAYNGELYVGGNFTSQFGPNMSSIAKWDGIQWQPVGNGLSGASWVNDFTIYQGKLVVAGYFYTAWGDPGNGIATWDGTQWSQLGAGSSTQVPVVEVYNGDLWACGVFTNPTELLSKWDGNQWNSTGAVLNQGATDMAVLGNDLYIGGGFTIANGDTVNRIIRYNYLTGFEELVASNELEIFPNPFTNQITINSHYKEGNIEIINLLGEIVFQTKLSNQQTKINLTHLSQGMYFLSVKTKEKIFCKKIVRE